MKNPLRKPFRYKFFNATLWIIGLNVLVYALCYFSPANLGLQKRLALNAVLFFKGHWFYQAFTYMFVHAGVWHLVLNMIGLLWAGLAVEKSIGSWEFILLYLFCGIFDGILSATIYWFTGQYMVFLMGASGAIYAILLVFSVLYPRSVISIWGIIPVPAPLLVVIYAVIEFVSQFSSSSNVAHMTHLLGFALAYLYLLVRMGVNPVKVWKNAWHR